jgi:cell fate regulator YaaT (PSP1 superfamily)
MGCGSCGTKSADGKPTGCQSNGGCSSGGCNRLNVFNWLSDIHISDFGKPFPIIEVSFNQGSRKEFFRNHSSQHIYDKGTWVAVEGAGGFDVGQVSLSGELVKLQLKKYGVNENSDLKKVLRPAAERDMELYAIAKEKERDTLIRSRAIARQMNLEMKIAEVEFQADSKKVCFFYTADARVDFRELIKVFAAEFRAKVEMRQIGARQESGKVGGIGSCGRELCCSTWLTDFRTVNTTAARYQNLSINQTKLSGQCGRLKCCLNYELDTYMDALHAFPEGAEQLEVAAGRAFLQKKDIFRNLMWYSFAGSNKQYPLTIERVREIQSLNAEGTKPEDLEAVEIQVKHKDPEKTVDMGFVNDVGQLTLSSLSKGARKKQGQQNQSAKRNPQQNNKPGGAKQGPPAKNAGNRQAQSANTQGPNAPQSGNIQPAGNKQLPAKGGNKPKPAQQASGAPQNRQPNANRPQQAKQANERQPAEKQHPDRTERRQGPPNADRKNAQPGNGQVNDTERKPRPNKKKPHRPRPGEPGGSGEQRQEPQKPE